MKCPYQTITSHKEIKENGKRDYEQITEFSECIGPKCPFYYKVKQRKNIRGYCKIDVRELIMNGGYTNE